ncbi:MAG: glycosyltransferase [Thermoplasmatota archaeon]
MTDSSGANIGFFPLSYNLAEVGRAILVALELQKLGINPVFFSHGGAYEYLEKKFGFDVITIDPLYTSDIISNIIQVNRKEKSGIPYHVSFLREVINNEVAAFKKNDIQLLVSFVNFPCSLSTKIAKIFHIDVSPGPGRFHYCIPDSYETAFTRFLPQKIKVPVFNYFFYKGGRHIRKPFNIIAKEHNLQSFHNMFDLIHGDFTVVTNFLEFINIFPHQQLFSKDAYVGIILLEELFNNIFPLHEGKKIVDEISQHLQTRRKKILLTMGSSGDKQLFLNLIHALDETQHQVVVVYGNILDDDHLPMVSERILLKKFVPSLAKLHQLVDLSIIHGGQGTVYTAAYAGKPIIGFPMQFEQHLHLEKMVGHGVGCMLSKQSYDKHQFLSTVDNIIAKYESYEKAAKDLSVKLPAPNGEKIAAKKIHEILKRKTTN